MSLRTVVLSAASVIIGIVCIAAVSTDAFARVPAGTTRLHHHKHHHPRGVHHSGQVQPHRSTNAPPAQVGR
jgi:hypothetical protein